MASGQHETVGAEGKSAGGVQSIRTARPTSWPAPAAPRAPAPHDPRDVAQCRCPACTAARTFEQELAALDTPAEARDYLRADNVSATGANRHLLLPSGPGIEAEYDPFATPHVKTPLPDGGYTPGVPLAAVRPRRGSGGGDGGGKAAGAGEAAGSDGKAVTASAARDEPAAPAVSPHFYNPWAAEGSSDKGTTGDYGKLPAGGEWSGPMAPRVAAYVVSGDQLSEAARRARTAKPHIWTSDVAGAFGSFLHRARHVSAVTRAFHESRHKAFGSSDWLDVMPAVHDSPMFCKLADDEDGDDGTGGGKESEPVDSTHIGTLHGKPTLLFHDDFSFAGDYTLWRPGPVDDSKIAECYVGGHRGVTKETDRDVASALASGRCIKLHKVTAPAQPYNIAGVYRPFGGSVRVRRVSFMVRSSTVDKRTGHAILCHGINGSAAVAWFCMRANGQMAMYTEAQGGRRAAYHEVMRYAANRWYRVEMRIDWGVRDVALSVDGEQRGARLPFTSASVAAAKYLALDTVDPVATCWFADITVEG